MRSFVLVLCLVLSALVLGFGSAHADIPRELAWQGVVLDSTNLPLADGVYSFHFSIFTDDVGGDSLWGESQAVTVSSGVLNVLLGRLNPIPDSVFAGPARYLQVQFETQVPYEPRTRVVSVGYSFRTNSVDGALAGSLEGDLAVSGDVSASGINVIPAPEAVNAVGGGSVDLTLTPDGGRLDIRDELNQGILYLGPDPDGEGGQITVSSNPASTQGITMEGNSDGSGEPRFTMVGSTAGLDFDLKPGGSVSLVLPPGSFSSEQIKDEAGLATGVQPGAIHDIEDDFTTLAAATATFPADGYVMVVAEATFRNNFPLSWIDGRLLTDGATAADWYWDGGDFDFWFDQRQSYTYTADVDSGTQTFELQVRQKLGQVDATDAKVTLIYLPTSYGLVVSSKDMGGGASSDTVQVEPPQAVSVNVLSERDDAVAANQARIEREVSDMAIRLAELKAELAQNRALLDTEP
jgi:hypothetical protein